MVTDGPVPVHPMVTAAYTPSDIGSTALYEISNGNSTAIFTATTAAHVVLPIALAVIPYVPLPAMSNALSTAGISSRIGVSPGIPAIVITTTFTITSFVHSQPATSTIRLATFHAQLGFSQDR